LKFSSVCGWPSCQSVKPLSSARPSGRFASAVRRTVTLTRGVWRSGPGARASASAAVTTPLATSPGPPSFSLAKTKRVSPSTMRLPPYIVFWAPKVNDVACGSSTPTLMANMGASFRCGGMAANRVPDRA